MIPGLDWSHFETVFDPLRLFEAPLKIEFAITRAKSGLNDDQKFALHRDIVLKAGVIWGTYGWFPPPGPVFSNLPSGYGAQFTEGYLTLIETGGRMWEIPPVLDLEDPGPPVELPRADGGYRDEYLKELEKAVSAMKAFLGRPPVVYSNYKFIFEFIMQGLSQVGFTLPGWLSECPLWVASWRLEKPIMPPGWTRWAFWQKAGEIADWGKDMTHLQPSISSVDLDFWPSDRASLVTWCHDPTFPIPDPVFTLPPPPGTTLIATVEQPVLNFRVGPGTGQPLQRSQVFKGASFEVLAQQMVNGDLWVKIAQLGWIAAKYKGVDYCKLEFK